MATDTHARDSAWYAVRERELGTAAPLGFARKLHFTEGLARKLCQEATLHGHTGCVNRLAWSEDGTYLVSGSDDKSVRVWRYTGDGAQRPLVIDTHHQGNIFGVAFLPATDNREIISGAMDYSVQHHVMEAGASRQPLPRAPVRNGQSGAHPSGSQQSVACRTTSYTPHKGRIKDVEVAPGNPNQFWSASEDGSIREYDKRCSTASQRDYQSANVLLEVTNKGRPVELKSVAVNRVRPHQMAVAAGDCYVRLYDRRMLSLAQLGAPPPQPLLALAPPHLASGSAPRRTSVPHGTYVKFSSRGDKVVATYHGDHAYSFDVTASDQPPITAFQLPPPDQARPNRLDWLSAAAEEERARGVLALTAGEPSRAVLHYSRALRMCPTSAVLYYKRAAALHQRGWTGDAAFALRDLECALACEPGHPDAMLMRAQMLLVLGQLEAATQAAEEFEEARPDMGEEIGRLYGQIEDATLERAREAEERAAAAAAARRQVVARGASPPQAPGSPPPVAGEGSPDSRQHAQPSPPAEGSGAAVQFAPGRQSSPTAPAEVAAGGCQGSGGAAVANGSPASRQHGGRNPMRTAGPSMWDSPGGRRLLQRFVGHCNCATDIKEAAFLGQRDELVAAGSDDGRVFIYNSETGEVVQALQADEDVANCVQPHPSLPLLATSGIESVIRLWSPGDTLVKQDVDKLALDNQQRMQEGPQMLRGINPRIMQALGENQELLQMLVQRSGMVAQGDDADEEQQIECRVQ